MCPRIGKDEEPIPGYRLVRPIGRGGFGEVWEAEAPGGLRKAIKFVFGDLESLNNSGASAKQELRSLTRVKAVRHPFLLSLERFDLIEGQLVIVTELADKDLYARFRECKLQGLAGIPRDELLRYMEETSEVLDLMNQTHDLQHLDIKPQNLCLLHNHIKVADFGLVKDLTGLMASMTGGMTPKYAAPETFRGVVTRFSDQYSLATVYQELLTGQTAFLANSPHELMRLHTEAEPNLDRLPPADRPVIARGLAKDPNRRYPTCLALVRDLQAAGRTTLGALPVPLGALPMPAVEVAPVEAPPQEVNAPGDLLTARSPLTEVAEVTGDGVLVPALIVGLGGFGLEALRKFRKAVQTRTGSPALPLHLLLLGIDTDPDAADRATRGDESEALLRKEVLLARLSRMSHYIRKPDYLPSLESWIPPKVISRIPRNMLTGGIRALGRLALLDSYRTIAGRLKQALDSITSPEAREAATRESGMSWRSNWPRVYVVTSLVGGTGGGMFLDVAYLLRAALRERGYGGTEIVGLTLLPPDAQQSVAARANGYAALVEIRHFAAGTPFQAQYDSSAPTVVVPGPPFDRTILLTQPDPATAAGDILFRELLTRLGREAEQARHFEPVTMQGEPEPLSFQVSGLTVLASATSGRSQWSVAHLGRGLLAQWTGTNRFAFEARVREEIQEQINAHGLNPQSVLAAFHEECVRQLGKSPEDLVSAWLEPVSEADAAGLLDASRLKQALGQVDRLLGLPEEDPLQAGQVPMVVRRVAEQLGQRFGQMLKGLATQYLDRPGFRLPAMAEAINQAVALLERVLQVQDLQSRDVGVRVRQFGGKLRTSLAEAEKPPDPARRRDKAARTPSLQGLGKTLSDYAQVQIRSVLLLRLRSLYISLIGLLSDQRSEVQSYRQLLGAVQQSLATPESEDESIAEELDRLTADDWGQLDQSAQQMLPGGREGQAVVAELLGTPGGRRMLRESVVRAADAFLSLRRPTSRGAVDLLVAQFPQEGALAGKLLEAFDAALPGHLPGNGREFSLLVAPATPSGERLGAIARGALPEMTTALVKGEEEVVLYRECELPFTELERRGMVCRDTYQQACSSEQHMPHTRLDVPWNKVD